MQLLAKSLAGEEAARELLSVLSTEFGVISKNLLAVMHDRASAKSVTVRNMKVLYPLFMDIGCYSYTIDHIGEFNSSTSRLCTNLVYCGSACSPTANAHLLWRTKTSMSIKTFSSTRWWSRWEVYDQLLNLFGEIHPFLHDNRDHAPSTRSKLLNLHTG